MGLGNKSNSGRIMRLWRGKRRKRWNAVAQVLNAPAPVKPEGPATFGPSGSEGFDAAGAGLFGPVGSEGFDAASAGLFGPVGFELWEARVAGIKGKQITTGADAVATANLVDGIFSATVAGRLKTATNYFDETTFSDKVAANAIIAAKLKLVGQTYDFSTATALRAAAPVAGSDVTTRTYVDALINGLTWQPAVATMYYIGTRTVVQINALTPLAGWSTVAGTAGTPTAGTSDALAIGDLAEFDGTSWKQIVTNSGGFPPNLTRATVAWPLAAVLFSPLTDGTDEGKVAQWDGTSLTPVLTTSLDGWAITCKGASTNPPTAFNENKQFAFTGVVPNGSWNQNGGPIPYGTGVVDVGIANAPGASSDLARVDHVHRSPKPYTGDKAQAPTVTSGNFSSTGITITVTPALDGDVAVYVMGIRATVGDGNRNNAGDFTNNVECYFSADGGTTPRAISAIVAGDTLYWNGTHAGYDLAVTDEVDIDYETF